MTQNVTLASFFASSMRLFHQIPLASAENNSYVVATAVGIGINNGYVVKNADTNLPFSDRALLSKTTTEVIEALATAFAEVRGAGYEYVVLNKDWKKLNINTLYGRILENIRDFESRFNWMFYSSGLHSTANLKAGQKYICGNDTFDVLGIADIDTIKSNIRGLIERNSSLSKDERTYIAGAKEFGVKADSLDYNRTVFGETWAFLISIGYSTMLRPSGVNDILKLATLLSGSDDISLSKGVKVSLDRPQRRIVLDAFQRYLRGELTTVEAGKVFSAMTSGLADAQDRNVQRILKALQDMKGKRDYWMIFAQRTNGLKNETQRRFPLAYSVLRFLRHKKKAIVTSNSVIREQLNLLYKNDYSQFTDFINWLSMRENAGLFYRNFDWILRTVQNKTGVFNHVDAVTYVLKAFSNVAIDSDMSATRLTLLSNMLEKRNETTKRTFFIKGEHNRRKVVDDKRPKLNESVKESAKACIAELEVMSIRRRLSSLSGKRVYIAPEMFDVILPVNRRGASNTATEGYDFLTPGSAVSFELKDYLRLFVWWIGHDVDLACNFYDSKLRWIDTVDFRDLEGRREIARHSGDVMNAPAPLGGTEYIDIDVQTAKNHKVRYVTFDLTSYSSKPFKDFPCFAGLMQIDGMDTLKTDFNINGVKTKVDVVSDTTQGCILVFDIEAKKYYICDVFGGKKLGRVSDQTGDAIKSVIELRERQSSFGDLICKADIIRVDRKEDASVVFENVAEDYNRILNLLG